MEHGNACAIKHFLHPDALHGASMVLADMVASDTASPVIRLFRRAAEPRPSREMPGRSTVIQMHQGPAEAFSGDVLEHATMGQAST